MSSFNDKGFIIKITPLNENDTLIIIFSQNHGRINAIAKGIKKAKSRRAGSIDLFNFIDFRIYEGKGDFDLLIEVKLIDDFRKLKADLDIININYYILELLEKTIPGHEKNLPIFEALKDFYDLQNGEVIVSLELITIMQMKLLDQLGYTPMLDSCMLCGEPLEANQIRVPSVDGQVGYLCEKHLQNTDNENATPDTIIKIQKFILTHGLHAASRLKVDAKQIRSLYSIQHNWLQNILEKKIYTADIINTIFLKLL